GVLALARGLGLRRVARGGDLLAQRRGAVALAAGFPLALALALAGAVALATVLALASRFLGLRAAFGLLAVAVGVGGSGGDEAGGDAGDGELGQHRGLLHDRILSGTPGRGLWVGTSYKALQGV